MITFNFKIGDEVKSSKVMVFCSDETIKEQDMVESIPCIKYNIDWYNWERLRPFDIEFVPAKFTEEMKYVAFKIESGFLVFVFEKQFIHEEFLDVAYNFMYDTGIPLTDVDSAGFIHEELIPYGYSESIGIESFHKDEITALLKSRV